MASRIDPLSNGYNQLFPTSGVNQSAQGFRNNFSSIYNNLYIAKNEISILHDKTFNFDVSGSDIIETSTTVPRLVVDGQESAPVSLKLTFRPNPVMPGTGALTVVKGTTTERPSTSSPGMIRFNTTTHQMEFCVGTDAAPEWVTIGGTTTGGSTFFNTAGDTISGNLIMQHEDPLQVAQILADRYVEGSPSYAFNNDTNTGLANPNNNELALITNGETRVLITDTSANFSPDWPNTNTEIHGQYRGFRQSKEYFVYAEAVQSDTWFDVLTWDTGSAVTYKTVGINCDFMMSGTDTNRGFMVSGYCLASWLFDRAILENDTVPPTQPTLVANSPTIISQQTLRNVVSAAVEFQVVYVGGVIRLQAKCTNDIGAGSSLQFDFSGKITVHYGNLGNFPMTPTHD